MYRETLKQSNIANGNSNQPAKSEATQFENLFNHLDENLARLEQIKNRIESHSHKISNYLDKSIEEGKKGEQILPNSITDKLSQKMTYLQRLITDLDIAEGNLAKAI